MKFKVGDKVIINDDEHGEIVSVDNRIIYSYEVKSKFDLARYSEDMLKLVQEPVPGKLYRTRNGDKLRFLVKGTKEYVYEDEDGVIMSYATPIRYSARSLDGEMLSDIVGDRVKWDLPQSSNDVPILGTVELVLPKNRYPYTVRWDNGTITNYSAEAFLDIVKTSEIVQPKAQEPVPGKYYRTRGGDKLRFLIRGTKEYVYEDDEGVILCYATPIRYSARSLDGEMLSDIVGEWIDEVVLPAVEIKRWAVVTTTNKRGDIESLHDNFLKAKEYTTCAFKDGVFEIVELTGTLPERKI